MNKLQQIYIQFLKTLKFKEENLEEIDQHDIQNKWLHFEETIRYKIYKKRLTKQDKQDYRIIEQVKQSFSIYILLLKIGLEEEDFSEKS
jgi:actin-related protein